jgi:aspartate oxidase
VFGARAAEAMQLPAQAAPLREAGGWRMGSEFPSDASKLVAADWSAASSLPPSTLVDETDGVRALMWHAAGLFRTRDGLADAVEQLDRCHGQSRHAMNRSTSSASEWKRFNLLTVARLIARAALRREESRGGHFREDFPARDDLHWQIHLVDKIDDQSD